MLNPVEAKELLYIVENLGYVPTRWERDFLYSIKKKIATGRYLSDRESYKLDEIRMLGERHAKRKKATIEG